MESLLFKAMSVTVWSCEICLLLRWRLNLVGMLIFAYVLFSIKMHEYIIIMRILIIIIINFIILNIYIKLN